MSHTQPPLKNAFLVIRREASSCAGLAASSEAPVLVLSSNPSLLPQMRQGRKWVYNDVFCRHGETCASDNCKKSCLLERLQKAVCTPKEGKNNPEVSIVITGADEEQTISFPQESNRLWSPAGLAKGLWQPPPPVSTLDLAGLVLAPPWLFPKPRIQQNTAWLPPWHLRPDQTGRFFPLRQLGTGQWVVCWLSPQRGFLRSHCTFAKDCGTTGRFW